MRSINRTMTARGAAGTMTFLLAVVVAGGGALAATPDAKCAAAKIRAAGKQVFDEAKCHQKAVLAATAVDPGCLAMAERRFAAAIAKADLVGSCPGTLVAFEGAVDQCVDGLVTVGSTDPSTTSTTTSTTTTTTLGPGFDVCCQGTSLCTQVLAAVPGDCSAYSTMAAGPAGTACDGTTGGCVAPPIAGGHCCQLGTALCLAGPDVEQASCENLDGTFFDTGTCTPSGCAP